MKGLRLDSHYEVLEKQIKALPESYYTELVHYISFLTQKVLAEKDAQEDGF